MKRVMPVVSKSMAGVLLHAAFHESGKRSGRPPGNEKVGTPISTKAICMQKHERALDANRVIVPFSLALVRRWTLTNINDRNNYVVESAVRVTAILAQLDYRIFRHARMSLPLPRVEL